MRTAIDTNILSALWGGEVSARQISATLHAASSAGSLVICPVVYVEARGHREATKQFVEQFLDLARIDVDWDLDRPVWQLAAAKFEQYAQRRRKYGSGENKRLPADFLIGAHASLEADRLLTLDRRRYGTDFPELNLVEV